VQTFTGHQYLMIDIANNYGHGLDKKEWDSRLSWFEAHEKQLHELVASADEPALFYAGIRAWEDVQANKPIGYMISLDATSSGLQLLAALTSDRKAAALCNVIPTGSREDAYTGIYQTMLNEVGDTAKIDREGLKDAVMTSLYGSKAMPKKIFGEGRLLDTFYDVMRTVAPAAWELNEAFLGMWDPDAYLNSWVLPDNFHVHVKVMNQRKEAVHFLNQPFDVYYNVNAPVGEGRSLGANTIHSVDGMIVRELTRRCDYDVKQVIQLRYALESNELWNDSTETEDDQMVMTLWQHYQDSGYLSARIIDHLKSENMLHVHAPTIVALLDSLPDKPFKVVSIHDCFRCLPHYGNDLRKQYNIQLQSIAKSDMLGWLISQIIGKPIQIGKLDPDLHIEIIDTDYALS
jgi:hypothetical protein